jgi:hypothetical protein
MERLHDRPFQDFVAHETHRLIPGDSPVSPMKSGEVFLGKKNEAVGTDGQNQATEVQRLNVCRLTRRLEDCEPDFGFALRC